MDLPVDGMEIIISGRLDFFKFEGFKTVILIVTLVTATIVSLTIKLLVLSYLFYYAPQGRPINTLTAVDQVIIAKF